MFVFDDQLV